MAAELRIREQIISKIEQLPEAHLGEVLAFLEKVEHPKSNASEIATRQQFLKSFAGMWKDMDDDFIEDLTTRLPERRIQETNNTP